MKHLILREEIARVVHGLTASGLVTGTSGNVSVRTPEGGILITPGGLDYALLEPKDVVLVDLKGRVLEGSLEPSSETPMHIGIYRARPEAGGIVHTHARYSTVLACLGWEIPAVHYMLATLSDEGRVPLAPYATYGTEELARHASDALGDSYYVCLLQNHGTIAIGETASKALSRTELLEEMAEIYYRARLAGKPILLTPEQMTEVSARMATYGQSKPLPEAE